MRRPNYSTSVLLFILTCLVLPAQAAIRYVDGNAKGANNGTSWSDAWTTLQAMTGVAAGDTVFISGGSKGSTQTYQLTGEFTSLPGYRNGTVGNPVTYKIGQDAAHNGTAIFNRATAGSQWLFSPNNVVFSGDAGDGAMHFKITNYNSAFTINNQSNVRISYLDCGAMPTMGSINPGNGIEIDHCYIKVNDMNADRACYAMLNGVSYGDNSFHDCTVLIPNAGSGIGADGLQWVGTGFSIYNNTITGYKTAYTGGQHQDGWQAIYGSKIKIYNNTFTDISNYAMFAEAYLSGYTDLYIYNNLVTVTDTSISSSGSASAVSVGTSGGYTGPSPCVFKNVVIANNTAVDVSSVPGQGGFNLNNVTGSRYPTTFTNCFIVNNISLNSNGPGSQGNTTSIIANNISISKSDGALYFTKYVPYGGSSNDLHPKATALLLIGKGTNQFSAFTKDMDGNDRPASGAWDLGAFAIGSSTPLSAPTNARISANP